MNRSDSIKKFYTEKGWSKKNNEYIDTLLHEDLRNCSKKYVSKCRKRLLKHLPSNGSNMLDMASGSIPYREYIEYSSNFNQRYCCDLSKEALEEARKKIPDKFVGLHGNFLDLDLKENFFDCVISLHTIYHIEKNLQEKAVRKLIKVSKKNSKIIILYSNPVTIFEKIKKLFNPKKIQDSNKQNNLYYFYNDLKWWNIFQDECEITVTINRSLSAWHLKKFIPDNYLGKLMLDMLFILENLFPIYFSKYFQYPLIILHKK